MAGKFEQDYVHLQFISKEFVIRLSVTVRGVEEFITSARDNIQDFSHDIPITVLPKTCGEAAKQFFLATSTSGFIGISWIKLLKGRILCPCQHDPRLQHGIYSAREVSKQWQINSASFI